MGHANNEPHLNLYNFELYFLQSLIPGMWTKYINEGLHLAKLLFRLLQCCEIAEFSSR